MTQKNTLYRLNRLFAENSADLLKYNLKSNEWWGNQKVILLKTYVNFSGQFIEKGSEITLLFKMQEKRFNYFIHHGLFFVKDQRNIEIGGVHYSDLFIVNW